MRKYKKLLCRYVLPAILVMSTFNSFAQTNTFSGMSTGASITTGIYNSFFGYYNGYANTEGNFNTFHGALAGYNNSKGDGNVFLGPIAGYSNTTGSYNSMTGYYAGVYNTTGSLNTLLGRKQAIATPQVTVTFLPVWHPVCIIQRAAITLLQDIFLGLIIRPGA